MASLIASFGYPASSSPALGHALAAGVVSPHLVGASLLVSACAYALSRRFPRRAAARGAFKRASAPAEARIAPSVALPGAGGPLDVAKGMLMVGHRGLSHEAPENTLDAIRLAFAHGAEGVEFDVQRSKDGELFLLHDDTLRRTAAPSRGPSLECLSQAAYEAMLDKDVSELSYWDFVRHVDVGAPQEGSEVSARPCLLAEVVAEIPDGRFALCEIKGGDEACARDIAAFVRSNKVREDKLAFIGFDFELMVLLKRLLVEAGMSRMQVIALKDAYTEAAALEHIAAVLAAGLDGVDFEADASVVTPTVVEAARSMHLHIGVWIWTDQLPQSDKAENVAKFHNLGVTFFTSDLPPDVREWMSTSTEASECSSPSSFGSCE